MADQPFGSSPSSSNETPKDLFFQIYEVELGNAEDQVFVDFCPSYVFKKNDTSSRQTFWQHFQTLLDAARLYAKNPIIIEALAELMLEQKGEEPNVRTARILDVAVQPDELRRRFQRHYDDEKRNIVVNEKWERFQELYAQAYEGNDGDKHGNDNYDYECEEDDDDDEDNDDDQYSYESEDVQTTHGSKFPMSKFTVNDNHMIPWEKQANAGAGVPPPHILAQMEMEMDRQRHNRRSQTMQDHEGHTHEGHTHEEEVKKKHDASYKRRLDPYMGTQVITHPYQSSSTPPWNGVRHQSPTYPLNAVEESLCQEVAALDPPPTPPETFETSNDDPSETNSGHNDTPTLQNEDGNENE